jgi:hypothetical protein
MWYILGYKEGGNDYLLRRSFASNLEVSRIPYCRTAAALPYTVPTLDTSLAYILAKLIFLWALHRTESELLFPFVLFKLCRIEKCFVKRS